MSPFSGGLRINLGFFDIFGDNLLEFARSIYLVQAQVATLVCLLLIVSQSVFRFFVVSEVGTVVL
jgi:hypothetical protein